MFIKKKKKEEKKLFMKNAKRVDNINIIIKGNSNWNIETIKKTLDKLDIENLKVNVIKSSIGVIDESDLALLQDSKGIIIDFNGVPNTAVKVIPYFCLELINEERLVFDIKTSDSTLENNQMEKISRLTRNGMKSLTDWQLIQLLKKYRKSLMLRYAVYKKINIGKDERKRRRKIIYEKY